MFNLIKVHALIKRNVHIDSNIGHEKHMVFSIGNFEYGDLFYHVSIQTFIKSDKINQNCHTHCKLDVDR
jgi:hypothetical protein